MKRQRANINRETLKIALELAPSPLKQDVESRFDLKKWLSENKLPTFNQIRELAKRLKLPVGFFWLNPENARKFLAYKRKNRMRNKVPYYRSNGLSEPPLELQEEIDFLRNLQEWISEFLQEEDAKQVELVGILKGNENPEEAANIIRKKLQLSDDWILQKPSKRQALEYLIDRIESAGIAVSISGVVGRNNKIPIPVDVCRGFTLVDPYIPWIFINGNDALSGQLFTLAHEIVHIAIGKSAADQLDPLESFAIHSEQSFAIHSERFCNAVAGAFILPEKLIKDNIENLNIKAHSGHELDFILDNMSKTFKASKVTIAIRLVELKKLNYETYRSWYTRCWQPSQESPKKNRGKGGNYYVTTRRRYSNLFLKYVKRALLSEQVTYKEVYHKIPLKTKTLLKLLEIE